MNITKERLDFLVEITSSPFYLHNSHACVFCRGYPDHTIRIIPEFGIQFCNRCVSQEEKHLIEYLLKMRANIVPLNVIKSSIKNNVGGISMENFENQPPIFEMGHLVYNLRTNNTKPKFYYSDYDRVVDDVWSFSYYWFINILMRDGSLSLRVHKDNEERIASIGDLWRYNPDLEEYFRSLSYKISLYDIPDLPYVLLSASKKYNADVISQCHKILNGGKREDVFDTVVNYVPSDISDTIAEEVGAVDIETIRVIVV